MANDRDSFNDGRQNAMLVQGLISEFRELSMAVAALSSELKPIRSDVASLIRIVRDGDNHEPLVSRVSQIEAALEEIEGVKLPELNEDMDKLKLKMIDVVDTKALLIEDKKDKRERRGSGLQFWGTIIVAVLSLVAATVGLIRGIGPK